MHWFSGLVEGRRDVENVQDRRHEEEDGPVSQKLPRTYPGAALAHSNARGATVEDGLENVPAPEPKRN